jgi:hypothetical protein
MKALEDERASLERVNGGDIATLGGNILDRYNAVRAGLEACLQCSREYSPVGDQSNTGRVCTVVEPFIHLRAPEQPAPEVVSDFPKEPEKKEEAPAVPKEETEQKISTEPIELSDLVLYDAKGKPFKKYDKLVIDGSCPKKADGSYLTKTQEEWVVYAKEKGKRILLFPLLVAAIEKMSETKHPGLPGLVRDIQKSWYCTSSRIDYSKNRIIQGYGFPEAFAQEFNLPIGNTFLDEIAGERAWRPALQSLFMSKDLEKSIATLNTVFKVRPYVWSPSADSRKGTPLRAVFVDAYPTDLSLSCSLHFTSNGCSHLVAYNEKMNV